MIDYDGDDDDEYFPENRTMEQPINSCLNDSHTPLARKFALEVRLCMPLNLNNAILYKKRNDMMAFLENGPSTRRQSMKTTGYLHVGKPKKQIIDVRSL